MALARHYVQKDVYTEAEYLGWEETAVEKSEFIGGRIEAMSGGAASHATIPMSIEAELVTALKGSGCRVFSSDLKVWAAGAYFYPDLSVVCGPSTFRDAGRTTITNPIIVVEVLSPSTETKDRGEKFIRYQQIESLRSYLLVSQSEPRVELFERGENGHWDYTTVSGLTNSVTLSSLGVSVALSEIYDQIDFEDTL